MGELVDLDNQTDEKPSAFHSRNWVRCDFFIKWVLVRGNNFSSRSLLWWRIILGTLEEFRKATTSFVMANGLSVCPHRTTRPSLDGFSWNLILEYILKICWSNSSFFFLSDKLRGYFTLRRLCIYVILEWEMFQTKVVEKITPSFWCSKTFFRKSCRLWDNVEKNIVDPDRPQMTI